MNLSRSFFNFILSNFFILVVVECAYVSLSKENVLPLNSQENANLINEVAKNNAQKQSLNNKNEVKISNDLSVNDNSENSAISSSSGISNTVKDLNSFFSNLFSTSSSKKPSIEIQNSKISSNDNKILSHDILPASQETFKIQDPKPISLVYSTLYIKSVNPTINSPAELIHSIQLSSNQPNLVKTISIERITKVAEVSGFKNSEIVFTTAPLAHTVKLNSLDLLSSNKKETNLISSRITKISKLQSESKNIISKAETNKLSDQIVYITTTVHSIGMSTKESSDQLTFDISKATVNSKSSKDTRSGIQAETPNVLSQKIMQNSIANIPSKSFFPESFQALNSNTESRLESRTITMDDHSPQVTEDLQTTHQGWWNDEENLKLNYGLEMGNAVVGGGYIIEEVVDIVSGMKVTEFITSHFTSTYIMTSTTTPYTLNVTSLEYVTISRPTSLPH